MRSASKPAPDNSRAEKCTGDVPSPVPGYPQGRRELTWRQLPDGTYSLHHRRTAMLSVVRDAVHAGMWRIRHLDGSLSDTVNLARVKDAAMSSRARHSPQKPPPPPSSGLRRRA